MEKKMKSISTLSIISKDPLHFLSSPFGNINAMI
jgi:hypothetical protein